MVNKNIVHRMQFALLAILIVIGVVMLIRNQGVSFQDFFYVDIDVVHVGTLVVQVEVANTPELRARGLSGREDLGNVKGLLMVFEEADYHGIWMKDMKFPIDVIWMDETGTVVDISTSLTPDSYPNIYEPDKPALYALEVDEIFIDTYNISEGIRITIPAATLQ